MVSTGSRLTTPGRVSLDLARIFSLSYKVVCFDVFAEFRTFDGGKTKTTLQR